MLETLAVQKPVATPKLVELQAQFERVNRTHERWVRSEDGPIYPGTVQISEAPKHFSVHAFVSGFDASELEVRIEPRRATIAGKKSRANDTSTARAPQQDRAANDLLRIIDLPVEVDIAKAVATLKEGVLELVLPKMRTHKGARLDVHSA